VPPPQRSARLYVALVERGLASSVSGSLAATEDPFLYTLSVTVNEGASLASAEAALLEALADLERRPVTEAELAKAKAQLRARIVFDNDSVTNIAHQLGYYETIASVDLVAEAPGRIAAVTLEDVTTTARTVLAPSNRTVGWFEPQ
jgi:zinc protease